MTKKADIPFAVQPVAPSELLLDAQNPRLSEEKIEGANQDDIARVLWQDKEVGELVDSIANNGYWQHEELFAVKESGRLVVVEGNRRLTAVKLLSDPALVKRLKIKGIPDNLPAAIQGTYKTLPVVICTRESLWRYAGFKHLNGPKEWDSVAKANYVANVHETYKVSLAEIARTIGDRHDTTRRLYFAYTILRQAENNGAFDRRTCYSKRFPFSHLSTGLGYKSVLSYLGIGERDALKPNPVPKSHLGRLTDYCQWLFGKRSEDDSPATVPMIRSQNPDLRNLSEVLTSPKAIKLLKETKSLERAVRSLKTDSQLLFESLIVAENALRDANAYVATGYNKKDGDIRSPLDNIMKLADNIDRVVKSAQ